MIVVLEDVKQVLALFDKKDIQYINFEYLCNKYDIVSNYNLGCNSKVKKKTLGGRNDKSRT